MTSGKMVSSTTADELDQNRSAEATAAAIATSLSVSTTATTGTSGVMSSSSIVDYAAGQHRLTRTPNAASVLDDEQSTEHEHLRSVMNAALDDMQSEQRHTAQPQIQRPLPHHLGPQLLQRYGTPSTAASMARAFSLRQRLSPPPRSNSTPPSNQLFGRVTPAGSIPPGYGADEETELMMAMRGMSMDGSVSNNNNNNNNNNISINDYYQNIDSDILYRARLLQQAQLRSQSGSGATSPFSPAALYASMIADDSTSRVPGK
jgi:hypothetical protein